MLRSRRISGSFGVHPAQRGGRYHTVPPGGLGRIRGWCGTCYGKGNCCAGLRTQQASMQLIIRHRIRCLLSFPALWIRRTKVIRRSPTLRRFLVREQRITFPPASVSVRFYDVQGRLAKVAGSRAVSSSLTPLVKYHSRRGGFGQAGLDLEPAELDFEPAKKKRFEKPPGYRKLNVYLRIKLLLNLSVLN